MEEVIQVQDQYYILATSSRDDEQTRVLKHGETFAVLDHFGNVHRIGSAEQGLYHEGTRFLSRLELRFLGRRPLLLHSTVKDDNAVLTVDLTNPDITADGRIVLPRDTVHISRSCFVWAGALYQRIRLRSYFLAPIDFTFAVIFEADFADIFEVRGTKRERRGDYPEPLVGPDSVTLAYRGLDGRALASRLHFAPAPHELHANRAEYRGVIPPRGELSCYVTLRCQASDDGDGFLPYDRALLAAARELCDARAADAEVSSSNEHLNEWLERSAADLHLMVTHLPEGPYPYAGVPWFSTVFGRDGIITALEYLWINPGLARGVLGHLAANQATGTDDQQDAEPGKILHETRRGEMAALGEIPFGRYYGSVDSTPLFVILAGAYLDRTADLDFLRMLWPHVEAALGWIDRSGDPDGDGFIEYARHSPNGLAVQGWKDSFDSVFHADGALAEGPVALCEVQGYVFAARLAAARIADALGEHARAERLRAQAEDLRRRFEDAFWLDDLSTYALALDGRKRPCRVRTSNPGHCLFAGIADPERAARVADTLLSPESFSGWGIRTVASNEARYNPMGYHNGSFWPHDNAIIAAGLARYRLMPHLLKVFSGLFDASLFVSLHRMPELFCGFVRRPGEGPTVYPVACAPQSWAAAAAFSLLQSLLGLTIDAPARQVRFVHPVLPESIAEVRIRGLHVRDAAMDLRITRSRHDVGVEILRREGSLELLIVK